MVVNPLRPTILLPLGLASSLTTEEVRMALTHELAHIRRGDLWLALVPAVSQALFFFFPLAWFACREWATARESACDAEAVILTGAPDAAYCRLLLKIVGEDAAGGMMPAMAR